MDSKFQSSFIPKTSVMGQEAPKQKLGFLGLIAVLIFVLSLISVTGVFFYKKILENSIQTLKADIASEETNIDKVALQSFIDFDKKIKSMRKLIDNHVAVSQFFKILEKNTISNIQFFNLRYSALAGVGISVEMKGESPSYATLAEQETVLKENVNILSVLFESLSLDKKGKINFVLRFNMKEDAVKFKNLINL